MEADSSPLSEVRFLPAARVSELSGGQECIISYTRRIAERNQIPLLKLLSKVLLPVATGQRWCYFTNVCALISGNSSGEFIAALEAISGRKDLALLVASSAKSRHGLSMYFPLSKYRKWCAGCFQADAGTAHGPYERLEWRFELVEFCSIHRSALCTTCPHCGATKIALVTQGDCSGFCPRCRGWLGAPQKGARLSKNVYEQWAATQVHTLVNHPKSRPRPRLLIAALKRIVADKFDGSGSALAKALGCAKSSVSGWLAGKVPISAERLIEISFIASIPLERLLANDLPERLSKTIRAMSVRERNQSSRRRCFNVGDARRVLVDVGQGLRPDITDRPALLAAAGGSPSALRKHLLAEYEAARSHLASLRRAKAEEARHTRESAFDSAVDNAIQMLLAQHATLSRRKIEIAMAIDGQAVQRHMSPRIDLTLRRLRKSGNFMVKEDPA